MFSKADTFFGVTKVIINKSSSPNETTVYMYVLLHYNKTIVFIMLIT